MATGTTLQRGESYCKDERFFYEDHKEDLICISATSGSSWEPVPEGFVKVSAVKGGRGIDGRADIGKPRDFLVPAEEYKTRSAHGFVVDPARHPEVTPEPVTQESAPGIMAPASRRIVPFAVA